MEHVPTSFLLLIVLFSFTRSETTVCRQWPTSRFSKPFWYDEKCYTWSADMVTWDEAKSVCYDKGGNLVKISSPNLYTIMMSKVKATGQCLWIGLTDRQTEREWKWLDGSPLLFHDWSLGTFNFLSSSLDCATICRPTDGVSDWAWSQETCSSRRQFLCEYEILTKIGTSPPLTPRKDEQKYRCKPWSRDEFASLAQDGDRCYTLSIMKTTWDEAKDLCSRYGGKLVKIPSPHVYMILTSNLTPYVNCFWIGATDRQSEGVWKWTDGSRVYYNDWEFGIVDYITKWYFDCGSVCQTFPNGDYKWKSEYCRLDWHYVCEYDAEELQTSPSVAVRKRPSQAFLRIERHSVHLLSKPDMSERVPTVTVCVRQCSRILGRCAVINFNYVSKICVGFSSKLSLSGESETSDNWEIWEDSSI